jgi:hypothetical protein
MLATAPVNTTTDSVVPAVLRTLAYADVFDYALTRAELHHYLIGEGTRAEVRDALSVARGADAVLERGGYFCLSDRTELVALRAERTHHATQLWPRARRWGAVIASLPFVRMVAVTGALAMNNVVSATDDIDLLVVTAPGRVWLARALCIGVVHVARRFGVELCPNYVLSSAVLAQSQRDLYGAHELAQMVPLAGHSLYAEMRLANIWTHTYLPNATCPLIRAPDQAQAWEGGQRAGERLLSGAFGDRLERWERRRKQRKFMREAAYSAAAQLDPDHVKGHFHDHGQRVLQAYAQRVAQLPITNNQWPVVIGNW